MDWANSYWIKCYVEDSPSFATCSWQAKGLFFLLARRFNAAGMLPLEKGDALTSIRYLCGQIIGGRWEDIRGPLLELIRTETIVIDQDWAFLKSENFVAAQKAKWGENHRKKAQRRRQRDEEEAKGIDFNAADPASVEAQLPPAPPLKVPEIPLDVPGSDPMLEEGVQGFRQGLVQGFKTLPSDVPKTDVGVQGLVQGLAQGVKTLPSDVPKTDVGVQGCVPKTDAKVQGFLSDTVTLPSDVPKTDKMSHTDQIDRSRSEDPSDLSHSFEKRTSEGTAPEGCKVSEDDVQQQSLFKGEQFGITQKDLERDTINRVWERYMSQWVKAGRKSRGPDPVLTDKRKKQILARCKDFGIENVLIAVDRLFQCEWRMKSGYTLIDYAIRSTEQTEKVLTIDPNPRPNRSGAGGNGRSRQSYAIQQGAPREDYKGTGSQWRTGADGKMRDQKTGKVVELEDDPLDEGIDFAAMCEAADRS